RRNVTYANVRNLKKMPQRRRFRCSTSASLASFVTSSRSQEELLSVIFEPREINHAIAFLHQEPHQRRAIAGAADAVSARRIVGGAVGRAEEIASVRIEKYSFLPIEFHRDMRAAVEIGMHPAAVADGEGRGRLFPVAMPRIRTPCSDSMSSRIPAKRSIDASQARKWWR